MILVLLLITIGVHMSSKIMTTFRLEEDLHRRLKALLNNKGMTLQGFIIIAIKKLMDELNEVKPLD